MRANSLVVWLISAGVTLSGCGYSSINAPGAEALAETRTAYRDIRQYQAVSLQLINAETSGTTMMIAAHLVKFDRDRRELLIRSEGGYDLHWQEGTLRLRIHPLRSAYFETRLAGSPRTGFPSTEDLMQQMPSWRQRPALVERVFPLDVVALLDGDPCLHLGRIEHISRLNTAGLFVSHPSREDKPVDLIELHNSRARWLMLKADTPEAETKQIPIAVRVKSPHATVYVTVNPESKLVTGRIAFADLRWIGGSAEDGIRLVESYDLHPHDRLSDDNLRFPSEGLRQIADRTTFERELAQAISDD